MSLDECLHDVVYGEYRFTEEDGKGTCLRCQCSVILDNELYDRKHDFSLREVYQRPSGSYLEKTYGRVYVRKG